MKVMLELLLLCLLAKGQLMAGWIPTLSSHQTEEWMKSEAWMGSEDSVGSESLQTSTAQSLTTEGTPAAQTTEGTVASQITEVTQTSQVTEKTQTAQTTEKTQTAQTTEKTQTSQATERTQASWGQLAEEADWLVASKQLSEGTANLGFSLLRKLSLRHDNNIVFSPLSLSLAMAVLMLGTTGQTKAQLESGLGLQGLNPREPEYLPALFKRLRDHLSYSQELNLIQGSLAFLHKDIEAKNTFLDLAQRYFDTQCVSVNFRNASQASGLLNNFVSRETEGKVSRILDQVDPNTKLILVDYLLLKGKWLIPFDPDSTEVDTFYLSKYQMVKVPTMYKVSKFASTFDKNLRCHVLQLPFRGNATMLVVVSEKVGDHLTLEDFLNMDLVEEWLRNMKTRETEVFFPKFKLDQKYEMHELLKEVGVQRVFSEGAGLSEISSRDIRVSQVVQRAVIEVDEKGTEAAAGTLLEIMAYSMPPVIKVNRPFLFMIYEEVSRMILFLGRVVNPSLL